MKCVSYVRLISCRPEKEIPKDIIRQQNDRIKNFIKEKGWELTKKYTDRKKNMDADDAFQQLRLDGINRKFDMVVVDSLFRCGKSVSYAEDVLLKTFYPAGIHFAVIEDNFCSLDMDPEMTAIYFKKRRNESFGYKLNEHFRKRQAEGYLTVHDEKYGYFLNKNRKSFTIDEEAAMVIREIFFLLAEKELSYSQVANAMNERGYESPRKHLARVGTKSIPECRSYWLPSSVRHIAKNNAYTGIYYKMMNGTSIKFTIPPIITQEQFEKVQNRYKNTPNQNHSNVNRSDNAFINQIFDKTTGNTIICRRNKNNGSQSFAGKFTDKKGISYNYVMQETISALRREQKKACFVKEKIIAGVKISEFEKQIEIFSQQARTLFSEMADTEKERLLLYDKMKTGKISEEAYLKRLSDISTQFCEKETVFNSIMNHVETIEKAFCSQNPWIQFYSSIKIPDILDKKQIRKWIDKVLIENMETVEVIFPSKYTDWKKLLPAQWFEEEM